MRAAMPFTEIAGLVEAGPERVEGRLAWAPEPVHVGRPDARWGANDAGRQRGCAPGVGQAASSSERTKNSATLAVTVANVAIPTTIVNPPTRRPAIVTGYTSP
jgi:hypothetical protein